MYVWNNILTYSWYFWYNKLTRSNMIFNQWVKDGWIATIWHHLVLKSIFLQWCYWKWRVYSAEKNILQEKNIIFNDSMENCRWQNYFIYLYILIYKEGAKVYNWLILFFLQLPFMSLLRIVANKVISGSLILQVMRLCDDSLYCLNCLLLQYAFCLIKTKTVGSI